MGKEEGLKKVKYYDNVLTIWLVSFIFLVILIFLGMDGELFHLLFYTLLFISGALFGWGMIYHAYMRDEGWWVLGILFIPFLVFYFYFGRLRKAFLRGDVEVQEELSEREKEKIKHYKEHKEEIDKKENEDFIRFLKGVGILVGLIILGFIIKFVFF